MRKADLLEEGLPYDQLEGSFFIEKGLLNSQGLALKSPVRKFSGARNYDFSTKKLDTMITVIPLGAYSNLLKHIPLFGSSMKGEGRAS